MRTNMGETTPMRAAVVVLVSANTEWQVVCRFYNPAQLAATMFGECFAAELPYLTGTLPVVFMHGGWGKIAAAASTQYALDRWQPELLINVGTCGGFAGAIEKGEIVLVDRTIVYDIVEMQGSFAAAIEHYSTTLDLSWLREPPYPVRQTLLISADRDLQIDEIANLRQQYGAVAGDWESGAIAYVAQRNQAACLILRGVSDVVSAFGNETYGNFAAFVDGTELVMHRLLSTLPQWLAEIDPAKMGLLTHRRPPHQ